MKKIISQKFEAIIRIILAVTVLFTSFGYTTSVFAETYKKGDVRNGEKTAGSTTNPGDVELRKTVEKTDEDGIYKVTLTAKGKNTKITQSSDAIPYIMFVLDRSGTMGPDFGELMCEKDWYNCPDDYMKSKYELAKKATINFSEKILEKYNKAQLGLVTFSDEATLNRKFESKKFSTWRPDDFKQDASGDTNTSAALNMATQKLLENKSKATKMIIVLLSDGRPEINGSYDKPKADAINAANLAKQNGIEIYTVAFDVSDDDVDTINQIATDKKHQFDARNYMQLTTSLDNITSSIEIEVPAGTDAVIKDVIADGFTYVDGSATPVPTTQQGKNITFKIDKITEQGTSVSFKIKADDDLPDGWNRTNDFANIEYKNSKNQKDEKKISTSPEVYWINDYEYIVNYYKDSINGTLLGTKNKQTSKNSQIKTSDIDINAYKPNGYKDGEIITDMPYIVTGENDVINVVYTKKTDLSYTVEYYKDGEKISNDADNTKGNQTFGDKVQSADIDINKYKPSIGYKNGTIETDMPYEIKEEDNIIKVCYIKRDDMSYTVKYLDKANDEELFNSEVRNGKTFEEVYTETAKDAPYGYKLVSNKTQEIKVDAEDKVVIFYYEKVNTFGYKVNYLEKDTENVLASQKSVTGKSYNETYTETAKTIKGYKVVGNNTQRFDLTRDGMEITFYYEKRNDLSYTVEYYKDGEKISNDADNTKGNQTFGDKVQSADIDINKYKPSIGYKNGTIETDMPYEIKEEDNIIKVCYIKRDDMSYTVKYLDKANDEELFNSEVRNGKTFEEVYTETAKDAPYGYKLVSNKTQEIKVDAEDKVIIFYYEKRNDFKYSVKYLEEGTDKELADTEYRDNKSYLEAYSEKAKNISGYNVVGENTQEFILKEENMEIVFYYTKKADLSYKVVYYKDSLNTEAIGEAVVNNQTFESIINKEDINVDLYKPLKGYNSGMIITDMPYTIIDGENIINVIYTKKDNLTYHVEYYYDGNIDSSKTEYFENLTYGDVITNYKEKLPAGYRFVSDTAPLIIDDTEDNVIKVYYVSEPKGDITPPKTGIYTTDYLSITSIIGTIALILSKKKQED